MHACGGDCPYLQRSLCPALLRSVEECCMTGVQANKQVARIASRMQSVGVMTQQKLTNISEAAHAATVYDLEPPENVVSTGAHLIHPLCVPHSCTHDAGTIILPVAHLYKPRGLHCSSRWLRMRQAVETFRLLMCCSFSSGFVLMPFAESAWLKWRAGSHLGTHEEPISEYVSERSMRHAGRL